VTRFQVLLAYDDDYGGYVVDVPELPGCMSQGKTVEEALSNAKDAIQGVLLVMEKRGEPYKPTTRPILVGEVAV
jgi:predicted RNase H-like HicB family nuclease